MNILQTNRADFNRVCERCPSGFLDRKHIEGMRGNPYAPGDCPLSLNSAIGKSTAVAAGRHWNDFIIEIN
jgi:hypothetical protein